MKKDAFFNMEEAARWAVRCQKLMNGGLGSTELNDLRMSLHIIEKYINISIKIIKECDLVYSNEPGSAQDKVQGGNRDPHVAGGHQLSGQAGS